MGVATWLRNRIEERACSFGIMKSEDESIYIYICREKRQSGRISHASSRDQHGRVHRGQRTRERGEGEGHGGMMEEERGEKPFHV